MTPPTEGAPSASGWLTSVVGVDGEFFSRHKPSVRPGRTSRALFTTDAIAGMLEEGGFYAASKYLRQRREL